MVKRRLRPLKNMLIHNELPVIYLSIIHSKLRKVPIRVLFEYAGN